MIYRDNPEIEKRYKSKRWQKLRKYKLKLNPLCERCLKKISYEDYEIYDGMCEECFEEIDLDDKDL